jgi:hypothetical protein
MDNNEYMYEIEIDKNTGYDDYFNCSNDEKNIRNKINELLKYCEFVILKDEFKKIMDIDDIELNYHINFLIDKLYFYLFIFEKFIKKEITKEYKSYEIILNQIELNNMFNLYINNDVHIKDSKNILLKLYDIIDNNVNYDKF